MIAFSIKPLPLIQTKDFLTLKVKSYIGTEKDTEQHTILDGKKREENFGKYLR